MINRSVAIETVARTPSSLNHSLMIVGEDEVRLSSFEMTSVMFCRTNLAH